MDNSPRWTDAATESPDKGGHPAYPFLDTPCTPFGINGVHHASLLGYTPCTPEENIKENKKTTWSRSPNVTKSVSVRPSQLPSLWITSRRPTSAQGSR